MNKKLTLWIAALFLAAGTFSYASAQEEPGEEDENVQEQTWEGGERPEFAPGPGMRQGMGPGKNMAVEKFHVKGRMGKAGFEQGRHGIGGIEPEEIENMVCSTIKDHNPAFLEKLEQLKNLAPAKYKMLVRQTAKMLAFARFEKDKALEKDVVKGISLEFDTRELGASYEKADDAQKGKIKKELEAKVAEQFDLKLKGQEIRIKKLDKEITKLRGQMEKRKANKSKIVKDRVDELVGEGESW
ncbi:MAG: hypothetical protein HY746_03645 [Elusimicrobia bacterium]|nr:hypothetical protein [Elusimicrobiota bacterium]